METEFIDTLQTINFTDSLKRKKGQKYCCVIGNTSVGKSSMLNSMFKLKLKTGLGTTTMQANLVVDDGPLKVYDAPGTNEEFDFYSPESLRMFASLDLVIICYDSSILNVKSVISTLSVINKSRIILVRTKCNLAKSHEKTPEQERDNDYEQLKKVHKNKVKEIYLMGGDDSEYDAPEIKQIMTNLVK